MHTFAHAACQLRGMQQSLPHIGVCLQQQLGMSMCSLASGSAPVQCFATATARVALIRRFHDSMAQSKHAHTHTHTHTQTHTHTFLFANTYIWGADLTASEGLVLFIILSLLHSLQQLASKGGITYSSVQNIKELMKH